MTCTPTTPGASRVALADHRPSPNDSAAIGVQIPVESPSATQLSEAVAPDDLSGDQRVGDLLEPSLVF